MANGSFVHALVFCFFEMLRGRSKPASGNCVAVIDDDVEVGNRRLSRIDLKEFAIDRKHRTEQFRSRNLTAHSIILDLAGNEITVRV